MSRPSRPDRRTGSGRGRPAARGRPPGRGSRRRIRLAASRFRLRVGLVLVIFVFSMFAGRLVQIQGVDAHAYDAKADRLDGAESVTLTAPRGAILDREGTPLAKSVDADMLVADPTMTKDDAPEIAAIISRRLDVNYFELLELLRKPDTRFVYLVRRVLPVNAEWVLNRLEKQDLAGVYSRDDPLRVYPAGEIGANIVGFVGSDGRGLAGLEYAFDSRLDGEDGHEAVVTDATGTRIPLAESSIEEPVPGTGLQLTIDRDLQWLAQRRLAGAVESTRSESGVAVTLDTKTFEVLALADYPTFDAGDPLDSPEADRGSRAIQDVFEPGSVQKVLTASALLDAGLVTPQTKINVPPQLRRGGHTINDWFGHGNLRLTMTGVLAQSSNIGTVLAAEEMSSRRLHAYLSAFGLGRETGIGMKGETKGLLPPADDWRQINHDTMAFGQGLSVNAVQMAAAVATIANGGVRIDPTLVKGEVDEDGSITPTDPPGRTRVMSASAARDVTRMMEMVTAENGTAPMAAIPGYRVAGKTGTAQRVDPETGSYAGGGFTLSFGGFAPADDPRFLTYVILHNPKAGGGGGSSGGPVFRDITSYALQKYAVPPSGSKPPNLKTTW
ncbi:MAG: penicillin-binding protein 2 [Propionibacteriales bacterium]|nr:penicillin-binding protein 2 [Propionibacteriales bacterium]